jgi:hypothetical protein
MIFGKDKSGAVAICVYARPIAVPSTIPAEPAPTNKLRRCINGLGSRLRDIACSNIWFSMEMSDCRGKPDERRTIGLWHSISKFDTKSRSFERREEFWKT